MKKIFTLLPILPISAVFMLVLVACSSPEPPEINVSLMNGGFSTVVTDSLEVTVDERIELVATFVNRETGPRDRFEWILTQNGHRVTHGVSMFVDSTDPDRDNIDNRDFAEITFTSALEGDLVLTVRSPGVRERSISLNLIEAFNITANGVPVIGTGPVAMTTYTSQNFSSSRGSQTMWSLTQGGTPIPATVANLSQFQGTSTTVTFHSLPTGTGPIHLTATHSGETSHVVLTVTEAPETTINIISNQAFVGETVDVFTSSPQNFQAILATGASANFTWQLMQGGNHVPTTVANFSTSATTATVTFSTVPTSTEPIYLIVSAPRATTREARLIVTPPTLTAINIHGNNMQVIDESFGMVAHAPQQFQATLAVGMGSGWSWSLKQDYVDLEATSVATISTSGWNQIIGDFASPNSPIITFNSIPTSDEPIYLTASANNAEPRTIRLIVTPSVIDITANGIPVTAPFEIAIGHTQQFNAIGGNATWRLMQGTALVPPTVATVTQSQSSANIRFHSVPAPADGEVRLVTTRPGSNMQYVVLTVVPPEITQPPASTIDIGTTIQGDFTTVVGNEPVDVFIGIEQEFQAFLNGSPAGSVNWTLTHGAGNIPVPPAVATLDSIGNTAFVEFHSALTGVNLTATVGEGAAAVSRTIVLNVRTAPAPVEQIAITSLTQVVGDTVEMTVGSQRSFNATIPSNLGDDLGVEWRLMQGSTNLADTDDVIMGPSWAQRIDANGTFYVDAQVNITFNNLPDSSDPIHLIVSHPHPAIASRTITITFPADPGSASDAADLELSTTTPELETYLPEVGLEMEAELPELELENALPEVEGGPVDDLDSEPIEPDDTLFSRDS